MTDEEKRGLEDDYYTNLIYTLLDRYNRYLTYMYSVDLKSPEDMIIDFLNDERNTISTFLVGVKK